MKVSGKNNAARVTPSQTKKSEKKTTQTTQKPADTAKEIKNSADRLVSAMNGSFGQITNLSKGKDAVRQDPLPREADLRAKPDPAQGRNVIQDPRQVGLENDATPEGVDLRQDGRDGNLSRDGHGPIGGGSMDVTVDAPDDDGRPDPLHGAYTREGKLQQAAGDRLSQRSVGGGKDPNAQGDGDPTTWALLTAAGLAGAAVSTPVGWATAFGIAAVTGVNYVYDAIIEDKDNDVPKPAEPDPVPVGEGGGGDISEEQEMEEDMEYVLDHPYGDNSTPHPDDTSGDNPNPGWTPDLTARPAVDARDTVSTPADPNENVVTAEDIQARIDSLRVFGPRTQNAINPGDQGGSVGRMPGETPPPADLPDEDPVGDPGSPEGPGEQGA